MSAEAYRARLRKNQAVYSGKEGSDLDGISGAPTRRKKMKWGNMKFIKLEKKSVAGGKTIPMKVTERDERVQDILKRNQEKEEEHKTMNPEQKEQRMNELLKQLASLKGQLASGEGGEAGGGDEAGVHEHKHDGCCGDHCAGSKQHTMPGEEQPRRRSPPPLVAGRIALRRCVAAALSRATPLLRWLRNIVSRQIGIGNNGPVWSPVEQPAKQGGFSCRAPRGSQDAAWVDPTEQVD